ncbi:hypothetical protein EJ110_NYTH55081 [Nymphaea thermarum]|nr:hypothetical protein EJ110_NYTH55081 [Nymphaea thermarum]
MAKLFGMDQTQGDASRIAVNFCVFVYTHFPHQNRVKTEILTFAKFSFCSGYMSPEYAMQDRFSIRSEIFSFGILLSEIVSGKMNASFFQSELHLNLVGYIDVYAEDRALELVDDKIAGSCQTSEALRCIQVVLLLGNTPISIPSPLDPAFVGRKSARETMSRNLEYSMIGMEGRSQNEVTMSDIEAR